MSGSSSSPTVHSSYARSLEPFVGDCDGDGDCDGAGEPALIRLAVRDVLGALASGHGVVVLSTPGRLEATRAGVAAALVHLERAIAAHGLVFADSARPLDDLLDHVTTKVGVHVIELHGAGAPASSAALTARADELRGLATRLAVPLRWTVSKDEPDRERPILRASQPPSTVDRLVQSEQCMSLLIASIHDYAIFMLDAGGHIATWNPGAQQINGYLAAEIIGRHFSAFYTQQDIASGKCERELATATETGRFEEEAWRCRKDGRRFWANVIISAVRTDDGTLVGFAKVTRDLTERRRAEHQRAQLAAVEEANRAKDEFLAMLGHELRNPLAPIQSALEIMRLTTAAEISPQHVIIERHMEHVVRLVDDLMDIARITQNKIELERKRLQLGEIVARAVEVAKPLIDRRRHKLTLSVPSEGLPIDGDLTRLTQVVGNLLTNAAKYTPVGGHIELDGYRENDQIVLSVKDDGEGLSDELLPRLFELFTQGQRAADRPEGGLGVGLAIARSLVRIHGGTVSVESAGLGLGTRFVVRVPADPTEPASIPPATQERTLSTPQRRRRVLLVDDNVDATVMLEELVQLLGHEVRSAYHPDDALVLLESYTPDLAILDIGLPGMDGYTLATHVREKVGARCQMVALTRYGQDSDRERSRLAGFDEHLVKPINATQLRRILATPDAE